MGRHRTNTAILETTSNDLNKRLQRSRSLSIELAAPLSQEDQCVQAMPDASPTKWHLAHTTWFYETFILKQYLSDYKVFNEDFHYCFNSYYEAEGPRHPRPSRGLLTRPSHGDVMAYRAHVDEALDKLVSTPALEATSDLPALIELGINHEQQHQELLLTDILALFAASPLYPAYRDRTEAPRAVAQPPVNSSTEYQGGIVEIGYSGDEFHFDCESPRHQALLRPFRIANRLVTNGEWLDFMSDGGYQRAEHWLSDGWATVKTENWSAPGYWLERDGIWYQMTLNGLKPIDRTAPVSHVSYFEADAFASWSGKRLPTEQEWEHAMASQPMRGNMLESGNLTPVPVGEAASDTPAQAFGDVWEWTASPFSPYPGFKTASGAVGEYNGKFMCGQYILRGASCVTPTGHSRATYRNFFYPQQRWQFMGLRLAEDLA